MRNVLEVHGLTKSYSNFSLNEVSFSVPEGCITGFIGTNGSGKTTTIRSILNLAKISSGEITLFGMNMQKSEKEIKNRVGIVMDEGYFYEGLTMNEMKSIIAPSYSEWDNSAYKNYMDMFSLDPNQNISTLSRGMKTKFALVLALSHKPELLIMDEPTSGLDPLIRNDLLDIIAEFMENGGKGVFFSTHITSDLDKIADTLIMIDNGTIIFSKSKDELLENYLAAKAAADLKCERIDTRIAELEAELENTTPDGRLNNRFVAGFAKYIGVEEITREMVSDVLSEVLVYPDGRLEIVWNYGADYKKLLLDLTGEQKNGKIGLSQIRTA